MERAARVGYRGQLSVTLSPIDEQSGNGGLYRTLVIWKARKNSASNNAAQTIAAGEVRLSPWGTGIGLAGTGVTGTIRMMLRYG
jgi:hypothetical protein